ncbi:MAG: hypothetical protein ACK4UU_08350 [Fimbriimonadales bacterium]
MSQLRRPDLARRAMCFRAVKTERRMPSLRRWTRWISSYASTPVRPMRDL